MIGTGNGVSSNYFPDHFRLQLYGLNLLPTHLKLFCTSDSQNPPPQHMALLACPTNQVFVSVIVIVWQESIWWNKINVSSPRCSFVGCTRLKLHHLSSFLAKRVKTNCHNRLPNPPGYWRKSADRAGCQSVLSALTEITVGQSTDDGRRWKQPYTYLSLIAICQGL